MSAASAAVEALELGDARSESSLGGGCTHDVRRVTCGDGRSFVCKTAVGRDARSMLDSERAGLETIGATQSVRVPEVAGCATITDACVLVLEWLEPDTRADWTHGGRSLGLLHQTPCSAPWGWPADGWLGGTPTMAGSYDDWCTCLGEGRLRPMLIIARNKGHLEPGLAARVDLLIDRLNDRIPEAPPKALLHGDLWAGNLHPTRGTIALLDPACMVGDPLADIAMAKLFGGVPAAFMDAWSEHQLDTTHAQERIAAVQAMHMLNHVCLFGTGYLGGLSDCLDRLGV